MAHYKTKFNQSYLYNNLPRTFIDFLKYNKKLRSFIKEINRNNNLYSIIHIIETHKGMNDMSLIRCIGNGLSYNDTTKLYREIIEPYKNYLYKYERKIYNDYMNGNVLFVTVSEYDRRVNNVKRLIKTFKQ